MFYRTSHSLAAMALALYAAAGGSSPVRYLDSEATPIRRTSVTEPKCHSKTERSKRRNLDNRREQWQFNQQRHGRRR